MSEVRWVKITTDMFDNRKIKHLRKLPEGNNIVMIWIMLLTMAGKCNAGGFIFLTENIPYTPKMLADELEFEETTVQLALSMLEKFGMISKENDMFMITGWSEHQNIEGMYRIREQNRERKRKQRNKEKNLLESSDMSQDSHVTECDKAVTSRDSHATEKNKNRIDKDIDIYKEREKEKEREKKNTPSPFLALLSEQDFSPDLEQVVKLWITYKQETDGKFTGSSLMSLFATIKSKVRAYGEKAVIDVINLSASNRWKGIVWDRLGTDKAGADNAKTERPKNRFNNFPQREYDMTDLERRLLAARGGA